MNMKMLHELCKPLCDGDAAALSILFRECGRGASSRGSFRGLDVAVFCFLPGFEVLEDSDKAAVDAVSLRLGVFLKAVAADSGVAAVDVVSSREVFGSLPFCVKASAISAPVTVNGSLCLWRCDFLLRDAPGDATSADSMDALNVAGSSTITVGKFAFSGFTSSGSVGVRWTT